MQQSWRKLRTSTAVFRIAAAPNGSITHRASSHCSKEQPGEATTLCCQACRKSSAAGRLPPSTARSYQPQGMSTALGLRQLQTGFPKFHLLPSVLWDLCHMAAMEPARIATVCAGATKAVSREYGGYHKGMIAKRCLG